MFTIGHFLCGNGPLVLGSMGHFKFKGANSASRSPRNIPAPHIQTLFPQSSESSDPIRDFIVGGTDGATIEYKDSPIIDMSSGVLR